MKSFARVTKLSNIGGRADYITNEKKQEAILAKSEAVDWKPYRDFERANQRTATANNEGREMIIALPNEWAKLPPCGTSCQGKHHSPDRRRESDRSAMGGSLEPCPKQSAYPCHFL